MYTLCLDSPIFLLFPPFPPLIYRALSWSMGARRSAVQGLCKSSPWNAPGVPRGPGGPGPGGSPGTKQQQTDTTSTRPGELTFCHGKIYHFSWENPLFLWPCSIAMLVHQRVNFNSKQIVQPHDGSMYVWYIDLQNWVMHMIFMGQVCWDSSSSTIGPWIRHGNSNHQQYDINPKKNNPWMAFFPSRPWRGARGSLKAPPLGCYSQQALVRKSGCIRVSTLWSSMKNIL